MIRLTAFAYTFAEWGNDTKLVNSGRLWSIKNQLFIQNSTNQVSELQVIPIQWIIICDGGWAGLIIEELKAKYSIAAIRMPQVGL